jgi:hypothetical protein
MRHACDAVAVNSTLDLQSVLDTIVTRATQRR